MNDAIYIKKLIEEGEHQQLDFKFEINDSAKIARTLSAFSNTDGGRLLIGVKDNGRIKGIQSEEEYYMIESAALRYCRPKVSFETRRWQIEGKSLLEVYIPAVTNKPVLARDNEDRWLAYIRVADQNILANFILLQVWKREQREKGTFMNYSEKEKIVLMYLQANPESGMEDLKTALGITNKLLKPLLINLISIGVIEMTLTEKSTTFSVKDIAL